MLPNLRQSRFGITLSLSVAFIYGAQGLVARPPAHIDWSPGTSALNKRFNDPKNPFKGNTLRNWLGTGDSFSAGPGAGDPVVNEGEERTCARNSGGYPALMQGTDFFQGGFGNPNFQFVSCTGDQIPQVVEHQLPQINQETDLVTLSIGGNDIGFAKILVPCIFNGLGDCDAAIELGYDLLYGTDVQQQWTSLINSIQQSTSWAFRTGDDRRTLIYQTAYPPFFDSWTTQCDDVSFFLGAVGPKLTGELRERLNTMGQELNSALASWTDEINHLYSLTQTGIGKDLIRFANQDERYNGHRFCREGVEEPDRNNHDTWFFNLFSWREIGNGDQQDDDENGELSIDNFASELQVDPNSCSADVNLDDDSSDPADAILCTIAKGISSGNITQQDADAFGGLPVDQESVQKTFHPRIAGFNQNSAEIQEHLEYGLPGDDADTLKDLDFRIMCMGDEVTIGLGDGLEADGYRKTLRDLLLGKMTDQAEDINTVSYVGSQSIAADPTEAYLNAKTQTLLDKIKENTIVNKEQPNVVLLMTGTNDILASEGNRDVLLDAQLALEELIGEIFVQCTKCLVMVSHVPPISNKFEWPPAPEQKQVIEWNAMISNSVNELKTKNGYRLTAVHPTVAHGDIAEIQKGRPSPRGHERIAYDIALRLNQVSRAGWIEEPDEGIDGNEEEKQCSAGVSITVNQVDLSVKPEVTVVLRNENEEEVNSWKGSMEEGQTQSIGGLGPDVAWKLVSHVGPEGSYDMEFSYEDDTWKWLECELSTEAGVPPDSYFESRSCVFSCGGPASTATDDDTADLGVSTSGNATASSANVTADSANVTAKAVRRSARVPVNLRT